MKRFHVLADPLLKKAFTVHAGRIFVPFLTRLENVQTTAKAKEASWDTWLGPMAINLRDLMHINLLYNASEPRTGACLCLHGFAHYVSLHYAARKGFEGMLAGVQMRVSFWTHFTESCFVVSCCFESKFDIPLVGMCAAVVSE